MSYLALYRKYRPHNFSELVGQDNNIKILKNSILNNMLSHAYLFSGPRGTGKTSTAKLIAKIINCETPNELEPCNKCNSCILFNEKNNPDIIEMDAASNNSVDDIRRIIDNINLMPSVSKYKIYIIDEVHMLSGGAFNALLKTLEEPPKHVIFILATTEFHKVPETIVSRCQSFTFERISKSNIVLKLEEIVKKENLKVEDDVLDAIAKYANGGMRDAINLLDKLVCTTNKVTMSDFNEIKGIISKDDLKQITDLIFTKQIHDLFNKLDNLELAGKNIVLLAEDLMFYIKDLLVKKVITPTINDYQSKDIYYAVDILNSSIPNMKYSSYPKVVLEVGLLKIIQQIDAEFNIKQDPSIEKSPIIETNEELKEVIATPINLIKEQNVYVEDGKIKFEDSKKIEDKITKLSEIMEENRKIRINNTFATADKKILEYLKNNWNTISNYSCDSKYASVVSYLIDGELKAAGENYAIVSVIYSSILKNALVNIKQIEDLFNKVMDGKFKIAFILESEWNELKKQYVLDINNKIKYEIKEEKQLNYESLENEKLIKNKSEIIKEAESLFGNDAVEID